MVAIGDIVLANGERWVVAELLGNAHGGRDARLLRSNNGGSQSRKQDASLLKLVEPFSYAVGDTVQQRLSTVTLVSLDDRSVLVEHHNQPRSRQRISRAQLVLQAGSV